MSSYDENVGGLDSLYQHRLRKIDEESRALLVKFQSGESALIPQGLDIANFSGTDFPRTALEEIRDSDLSRSDRLQLITYFLGCWHLDQVGGAWTFVPMLVEESSLYISFGVGIKTDQGSMINIAESAREIIEGTDLSFEEAFYTANVKVEQRFLEAGPDSVREE